MFDKGLEILRRTIAALGEFSGVYQMINAEGAFLYIGKAKNLPKRLSHYTHIQKLPKRLQRMVSELHQVRTIVTNSEHDALILESKLIYTHKPRYNILLKEKNAFYFITIGHQSIPLITYKRLHRLDASEDQYIFGPYLSSEQARNMVTLMHRMFGLRSCSDHVFAARKRPCLKYHIKECLAPCVQYIQPQDYQEKVQEAVKALQTDKQHLAQDITERMYVASAAQRYEEAKIWRDRLYVLNHHQETGDVFHAEAQHVDVAFYHVFDRQHMLCVSQWREGFCKGFYPINLQEDPQEGCIEQALSEFYETASNPHFIVSNHLLNLKQIVWQENSSTCKILSSSKPYAESMLEHTRRQALHIISQEAKVQHQWSRALESIVQVDSDNPRIEIYDNSHLHGTCALGAMVVYEEGRFARGQFRTFRMEAHISQNDLKMMHRMIVRRFIGSNASMSLPHFIVIDGGKTHLKAVQSALNSIAHQKPGVQNIRLLALAKGAKRGKLGERLYSYCATYGYQEMSLSVTHPLLVLLAPLRNQAHRYAINSHRKWREKNMVLSALDNIQGLGPKKRQYLQELNQKTPLPGLSLEEWQNIAYIGATLGAKIFEALRFLRS